MKNQSEQQSDRDSQVDNNNDRPGYRFVNKRGRPIVSATMLCNMPVHNKDGRDLGVLSDLMFEAERGTATYAILLFENNKTFALPFSALEIDLDTMTIYVDIQYEVFAEGTGMTSPAADKS